MSSLARSALCAEIVGPFVLAVWHDEMTLAATEHVGRLLHRAAAEHPEGIGFVTVAQFKAPIPSAAIRARIVEIYTELGDQLVGVAQTVEGEGFWASAALCFVAGLGLLHRHSHKMKVFGDVGDASDWICGLGLAGAPTSSAVHARLMAAGHRLDGRSPEGPRIPQRMAVS